MSVENRTLGELIDMLITTSMRCWFAQEDIMDETLSEHDRLDAAIRAQVQNSKRSDLVRAIDELVGMESSAEKKSYTYFKKDSEEFKN